VECTFAPVVPLAINYHHVERQVRGPLRRGHSRGVWTGISLRKTSVLVPKSILRQATQPRPSLCVLFGGPPLASCLGSCCSQHRASR
jgi:hypothetical protein